MYKATARWLIRRNIRTVNEGRYGPALAMFAPDATLTFPGDNSWSRQHREPRAGREPHPTHKGRDEIEAFLRRYVDHTIQMEVEDILVNGPPWNMRAAVRVHDWILDENGKEIYSNRAVLMVRVHWGRIRDQEDYEDTERVSALDSVLGGSAARMEQRNRLVTVVLEVADLDRSVALYRNGFGLDLHITDHGGAGHGQDDRWVSGRHAAITWGEGSLLHFALYESKGERTSGAQVSFRVDDIGDAHLAAVSAGAQVLHEPRPEPWGTSARYRDLDRNVVELTQPT